MKRKLQVDARRERIAKYMGSKEQKEEVEKLRKVLDELKKRGPK